jgi:phosphoenolpyruvate carboxylase
LSISLDLATCHGTRLRAKALAILDQARNIRDRFPYIKLLHHIQIELLKRYRAGDADERVIAGIHLTINGITAGLRNSG